MKKLCVLFPGIGYHCDKPLLYYSSKLAAARGYEVKALKFSDFPSGAKGNDEKMRLAAAHALSQSEEQLSGIPFSDYGRIVLIGKSIGTCAALAFKEKYKLSACGILFTPLEFTFEHSALGFSAFSGSKDQWADFSSITRLCDQKGIPLYSYENANHSLETGDALADIKNLSDIISKAAEIIL